MIFELIQQYFFQALINSIAVIYVISELINRKIDFKNHKIYITLFLFVLISIITFIYVDDLLRFLTMTITALIGNYYLFRLNIKETIISTVFEQLIVFISEIVLVIFSIFVFKATNYQITNDFLGNLFYVTLISLLMIVFINFKFVKKVYNFFSKITFKVNVKRLSLYTLIIIASVNFLFVSNFLYVDFHKVFLINIILIIAYSFILFYALYEQNENEKFKEENRVLIESLNEYEKMLDHQRIDNHENKNQLLVIKGMIDNNDEKVSKYLDEIIKEKREDNEILYNQAKRIPSGGLQGLVYQKMLVMQDNHIQIHLDVSKKIRNFDFTDTFSNMNYDICRVIGVFLDNAIEEVTKNKVTEREILISMYIDDCFIIEISNRVNNKIQIDNISKKGYTTKRKGRGYGLALVDQIIKKNNNLKLETIIANGNFIQRLKITI